MTQAELRVLRAQLHAERQRLHQVVAQLEALRLALGGATPNVVELMAAGGFLHNVYNGIENCLNRLAHGVDESVPNGSDSHRLLLDQFSEPIFELRPALLDPALTKQLDELRRFRHAFRHMYFFDLDWARLGPLVDGAPGVVAEFDLAIDSLLTRLGA